jgi:hypothetical protein
LEGARQLALVWGASALGAVMLASACGSFFRCLLRVGLGMVATAG